MKLAILSDMHIGYERFEEDSYKQAEEALISASEQADAILIAGDVFDKRAPKPEVIAHAINVFRTISRRKWNATVEVKGNVAHTKVPIIAIPGTHERVAEGKENVLKLLALAGLIIDTSESTSIIDLNGEKVAVFGLGGISEERVRETLGRLSPKPVSGMFNVFMLHQSIYELLPFSSEIIKYEELPKGFDLYINGHIHSRVEATVHGKKFLIPGSTVLTQLKENEQATKGFILFDTKSNSHEFKQINSRKFVCVDIKVSGLMPKDIVQKCESEIENILSKNKDKPIIRLKISGEFAEGFSNSDIQLRNIIVRYSNKAYLEIDSSKLKSSDSDKSIEDLREGIIGGVSMRELGISTFIGKLKEQKVDESIDMNKLFEILSSSGSKEKIIKMANELLEEKN